MNKKPKKGSSKPGTAKRRRSVLRPGEIEELRARLTEAEETLRAIREGEVDAIVVSGKGGDQVYSLVGAESIYRLIVETMNEAAFTVTFDGRILFCNSRFGEFVKRPLEQVVGHPLREFVEPQNVPAAEALLITGQKQPVKQRLVFHSADGATVPAHISATVLNESDRESICIVATDLTDLERSTDMIQQLHRQREALLESEQKLFEVNQRLRALMNALPVGVSFSNDASCRDITGNPAALAQFDAKAGDNISASAPDDTAQSRQVRFFHAGRQITDAELPLQRAVAENREIPPMELEVVMPSGRRWYTDASGAPICDGLGNAIGGVAVTVDITDRKRAEEALRQANATLEQSVQERTKELRRISSELLTAQEEERKRISKELHDELGQSLTLVKMRVGLIAMDLAENQRELKEHCRSAFSQINQLIEVGRRLSRDLRPAALEDLGVIPVIQRLATEASEVSNIRISTDFDEIDQFLAPESRIVLYRVFQESLTNIMRHSKATEASLSAKQADGRVVFEVRDNGQGIDFAEIESAQEAGRGGLGLALMKERVQVLGGSLEISSQRGIGTRLTFSIPIMDQGDR